MIPCANLTLLFTELPLLDRFDAAAEAGFKAVEILFPYDDPVPHLKGRLAHAGLEMALINTPPPNWTGGDRGFAAVPGGEARFRSDFRRALRYAAELQPRFIHIMSGPAAGPQARATMIENLAWAAAEAPDQQLTLEPLNTGDNPGYYLSDFDLAAAIIAEVGAPNLGLQYDTYHAGRLHGDALAVWDRHKDIVTHVQIGDMPDRCDPGQGEIDFAAFFARLAAARYDGYVSGEYNPVAGTEQGLGWMQTLARAR